MLYRKYSFLCLRRIFFKYVLFFITLLVSLLFSYSAWAEFIFQFYPFITLEQRYDDNIFLSRSNTRSDWISTVSPGFFTSLSSPRINGELEFKPGLVYFLHNPQFDYTSYEINFDTSIELTSRLNFSLLESYIRSNEPDLVEFEETDYERELRRDNRTKFNRNVIAPQIEYQFGRENLIRLYYRNTNYRSDDPFEDDYREHYFEGQTDYWFNIRNGIVIWFHYIKGNFDIDSDLLYSIDVTPRYMFRVTPHFQLYGEYGYGTTDFEDQRFFETLEGRELLVNSEDLYDYDLHRFNVGFEWQLPQNFFINGNVGYFWRYGVSNRDDQGIISSLEIAKTINNLVLNIEWESGFDSNYFASRDSGFAEFWRVAARSTYVYHERLEWIIRGSYGYRDYADLRTTEVRQIIGFIQAGRDDYIYSLGTSLSYQLFSNIGYLSDLSLKLAYSFVEVDSNLDTTYYINNRSWASITATF